MVGRLAIKSSPRCRTRVPAGDNTRYFATNVAINEGPSSRPGDPFTRLRYRPTDSSCTSFIRRFFSVVTYTVVVASDACPRLSRVVSTVAPRAMRCEA